MTRALRDPESIYDEHIASLPVDVKLRLVALIAERVAAGNGRQGSRLEDLDGLGKEIWAGVNTDAHVQSMRDEWSGRP